MLLIFVINISELNTFGFCMNFFKLDSKFDYDTLGLAKFCFNFCSSTPRDL